MPVRPWPAGRGLEDFLSGKSSGEEETSGHPHHPASTSLPSVQVQQAIRQFLEQGQAQAVAGATPADTARQAAKAASCSSYQTQACAAYEFDCASGDTRKDGACTSFTRVSGTSCGSSGAGGVYFGTGWGDGGGRGGGGGGAPAGIPLAGPPCASCQGPECRCTGKP